MAREVFGPESTNPRLRRAFAHAQLHKLRAGEVTFEDARITVDAASHTRKGRDSNFESVLHRAAGITKDSAVFVHSITGDNDLAVYINDRRAQDRTSIDTNAYVPPSRSVEVSGYVMPKDEVLVWEKRYSDSLIDKIHPPYEAIHTSEYPSVVITTSAPLKIQRGTGYDLAANPAKARLVQVHPPRSRR